MDAVALASVITSGVVGLGGLAVSWSARRQTASLAREGRQQERLERAYLEVLQYAELEGMWAHARLRNLETWDEYGSVRPIKVERPTRDRRAIATALLAAFGSARSQRAFGEWIASLDSVDDGLEVLEWNWRESGLPNEPPEERDVQRVKKRVDAEAVARHVLGSACAAELEDA